jgi:CBS domain-containing protein
LRGIRIGLGSPRKELAMRVRDVMSGKVMACGAEEPLSSAARIMWEGDCGFVPVLDFATGRLRGVVTDRDACMASYTQGKALAEIPVLTAMTSRVHTCRADDPVEHAEDAMAQNRVRRLPVLDADDRLVGVISLNDIARRAVRDGPARMREDVADTLGQICQHRAHVLA